MPRKEKLSQTTRESRHYHQELRAFGQWIRQHRKAQKLTIEGAAEKLEMDPTHLAKIEAGTINVSFVTIVRILKGLELPALSDLLDNNSR